MASSSRDHQHFNSEQNGRYGGSLVNKDSSDEIPTLQMCFDAQYAYDLQRELNSGKNTGNFNRRHFSSDNIQLIPPLINGIAERNKDCDIEEDYPCFQSDSYPFPRDRTDADIANQLQFQMYVESRENQPRRIFNQSFFPVNQIRPQNRQTNPFTMSYYPGRPQSLTMRIPQIGIDGVAGIRNLSRRPQIQENSRYSNPLFALRRSPQTQAYGLRPTRGSLLKRRNKVFKNFTGRHASVEEQDDLTYEQMIEIEDQIGCVPAKGLKKQDIQRIPKFRYCVDNALDANDGKCAICCEIFTPDKMVRQLKCDHIFDVTCIDTWLEKKAECPVCRQEIQ